jgi:hypothetical protein
MVSHSLHNPTIVSQAVIINNQIVEDNLTIRHLISRFVGTVTNQLLNTGRVKGYEAHIHQPQFKSTQFNTLAHLYFISIKLRRVRRVA